MKQSLSILATPPLGQKKVPQNVGLIIYRTYAKVNCAASVLIIKEKS